MSKYRLQIPPKHIYLAFQVTVLNIQEFIAVLEMRSVLFLQKNVIFAMTDFHTVILLRKSNVIQNNAVQVVVIEKDVALLVSAR